MMKVVLFQKMWFQKIFQTRKTNEFETYYLYPHINKY